MQRQPAGEFREIGVQDLARHAKDEVPPGSRGDAAEREEVLEGVMVGILGQGIAEVDADGFEDAGRAWIALLMEVLHGFELVRGMPDRKGDPGVVSEAHHGLLGEILHPAAKVARPFIGGGVRMVIDGSEGEFVEPTGDATFGVEVTGRLAGAHGDAQEPMHAERHGAGEGGDIAVVGDFEGNAPFTLQAMEQRFYVGIEAGGRHGTEERGDHDMIVDVDAGGTAADGIDAREMLGGELEAVVDAVVVEFRIRLVFGVPGDFRGEDRFAILDGSELIIAGAEIKSDPTTVQVTAESHRGFLWGGDLVGIDGFHHERVAIDPFEQFDVERAGAAATVDFREGITEAARAADGQFPAANLPEEELDQALGVGGGGLVMGGSKGQDLGVEHRGLAVVTFQGQGQRKASGCGIDGAAVTPIAECDGEEVGIERGLDGGAGEEQVGGLWHNELTIGTGGWIRQRQYESNPGEGAFSRRAG
jgi:hypothetical protein